MATKSKTFGKQNKNKTIKNTLKKMVCSPSVIGNTSVNNSCFTDSVLLYLKEVYNKHHPISKIDYKQPAKIWNSLKNKLSHCKQEDCWLNEINDENVRSNIDKLLFAPDSPAKWIKHPDEWLSNLDINNVLKQYEIKFPQFKTLKPSPIDFDSKMNGIDGPCVNNDLCNFNIETYIKLNKTKIGIVYNLDKHNQSGSHWVSLFIDIDDKYIFFMDSAGETIPPQIKKFVTRVIEQATDLGILLKYYENSPLEHQHGNTECGMYSLFFIITLLTNQVKNKEFKSLKQKINFFTKKRIPDKYIFNYRKQYFNI
jgi:hypothetical protein